MRLQSTHRSVIAYLCLCLCFALTAVRVEAQRPAGPSITVNVGQPNVWSLAQAHYLLAEMREGNRGLRIPSVSGYLDPNSANGTRMDILRTFFGVDVQYSQVAGLQNRAMLKKFEDESSRRRLVQGQLDEIMARYLKAVHKYSEMSSQLASLTGSDPSVEQQRKDLTAAVSLKKAEVDTLNAQVTALNAQLTQAPSLGTLNSQAPFSQDLPKPNEKDLTDILDKIMTKIADNTTPKLGASIALDNYVQMQYELIAKQLTLLRDEVRPGERLIFLELPSDIYTVPKNDDDYVVQVEWSVARYFGKEDPGKPRYRYDGPRQAEPLSLADIQLFSAYKKDFDTQRFNELSRLSGAYAAWEDQDDNKREQNKRVEAQPPHRAAMQAEINKIEALSSRDREFLRVISNHPQIIELNWIEPGSQQKDTAKFRVIDIIPRQSALNVNDVQAQTKGFALAARFLTVFGLGGQVDYQRQRTLYSQFMQQEVYASGYGKGQGAFGWTFGPLPGTKRLAPGVRTTYAILSIPDDCLAVELQPKTRVYPRTQAPSDVRPQAASLQPAAQRVLIPGDQTQGFWIDRINYTPVKKGERVTTIIRGRSFSPLTGVLVDGVPLKRAVSIAKNEGDSTTLVSAIDSFGEYEYLNSNQIIMSFKLSDASFIGTPGITLVTPEKTYVINGFEIRVNGTARTTLDKMSAIEPMFLDEFSFASVAQIGNAQTAPSAANGSVLRNGPLGAGFGVGFGGDAGETIPTANAAPNEIEVRLSGAGFRPGADIFVDDARTPLSREKIRASTNEIRVSIPPLPAGSLSARRTITYRYGAQQASRFFEPTAPSIDAIDNPVTGKAEGPADGGYRVTIRGSNLARVETVLFGQTAGDVDPEPRDDRVLFVKVPPGEEGAVQVLLTSKDKKTNIGDFGAPGKAVYRYTGARPKASHEPSITEIENPSTRTAEGVTGSEADVTIRGRNLDNVNRVRFGGIDARILEQGSNVLLVNVPAVSQEKGVQVLVETGPGADGKTLNNLTDFQTPGKATYRFVAKPKASAAKGSKKDATHRRRK